MGTSIRSADRPSVVPGTSRPAGRRIALRARTFMLTAGDDFGATPPLSSFFNEEPSVKAQRLMGIQVGALGNHNFDRGVAHLQQMIDLAGAPTGGSVPGQPFRLRRREPEESRRQPERSRPGEVLQRRRAQRSRSSGSRTRRHRASCCRGASGRHRDHRRRGRRQQVRADRAARRRPMSFS